MVREADVSKTGSALVLEDTTSETCTNLPREMGRAVGHSDSLPSRRGYCPHYDDLHEGISLGVIVTMLSFTPMAGWGVKLVEKYYARALHNCDDKRGCAKLSIYVVGAYWFVKQCPRHEPQRQAAHRPGLPSDGDRLYYDDDVLLVSSLLTWTHYFVRDFEASGPIGDLY